ncbi:LacI family DNA-binding transcriptional regulator [Dysgonomonas sp. GY617]|uniref:LacI family DNA-binding transcriptional regulator n=1 Tax=Dysgonomonas sp. GY617 TaxID=2780420 RepID=UPI00188345E8|nr:LacI family DNA-binding transcriptional regulator [Dysgonomonas sp. GY617]MBF0575263.1 LacI family DNA-binding transcriptional regulator [Dysgonomonas sp. GY617]
MARVSIKDIAIALGVSNATVSLVINGKEKEGRVGFEMAEKIRAKAKELNYEPNNLARSLRIGRSETIGLIVADISNIFFATLAFHIQEYAEKLGYTIVITNTNEDTSKMGKMIHTLQSRQVDGFIIVPTENGEEDIAKLVRSKTPVVLLDRCFPAIETSHVMIDNYQTSYLATRHLIALGCKKIALLTYKNRLHHMTERKRGYVEAVQNANIFDAGLIKEVSYENITEDTTNAINDLLKIKDLDGIFFSTDSVCVAGIKYMQETDKNIFKKVNLMSFDRNEIFDFVNYDVPYMMQPLPEMGRRAIDILVNQIVNKSNTSEKIELQATLHS